MGVGRNKFQGLKFFEIEIQKRRKPAAEINKNYYIRNFCERSEQIFFEISPNFFLVPSTSGQDIMQDFKKVVSEKAGVV